MHVQDLSTHFSHCKASAIMQLRHRYHPPRQPHRSSRASSLKLIKFNRKEKVRESLIKFKWTGQSLLVVQLGCTR